MSTADYASFDTERLEAFHDLLLGGGAVSLPVLREQVDAWIAGGFGNPPRVAD